ncbi:MAG: diaminopimelate epimerase [SAR324 cluster bacterium]|nr:diaminopimelate epimerase [SAR324 cluster bacterium]
MVARPFPKVLSFWKMQATSNDYVCLNAFELDLSWLKALAPKLCERRRGVGADGFLLVTHSSKSALRMIIYNADGSEAEMCGNGLRCVARFAYEQNLVSSPTFSVETKGGERMVEVLFNNSQEIADIKIDMGKPDFELNNLPAKLGADSWLERSLDFAGFSFKVSLLSLGNPHLVVFVDNLAKIDINRFGPIIENDARFPNRINVSFVEALDKNNLKQRTWERGVKETYSCGTGAVASVVVGILTNRCSAKTYVHLLGGRLSVQWEDENASAFLTGEAINVFKGSYLID